MGFVRRECEFCYLAAGKSETGGVGDEETSATIQHKANPYPVIEALDDAELRTSVKRTQLIVVASLIDKQTNLGGMYRYSKKNNHLFIG